MGCRGFINNHALAQIATFEKNKSLARKETYRSKYISKTADGGPLTKQERVARIPINPAIQLPYAEGKVLLIDKPLHWTSFDVVRKLRNILQIKKIGHAGTLDPLATGLLIVCTGKFTKKINDYMAQEKEYTGHIVLGAVTPTFDLESEPVQQQPVSHLSDETIKNATGQFTGAIQQLPPIYSAIKKDGVALYELARKGKTLQLEPRNITIHSFEITSINLPEVRFKVVCSTGSYIRSLANDFGAALGCGGYLGSLRRTRIGVFDVNSAVDTEDIFREVSSKNPGVETGGE